MRLLLRPTLWPNNRHTVDAGVTTGYSALIKSDPGHRAASFLSKKILAMGQTFIIKGGDGVERTLLQVKGELNGNSGIYEYILTQEGKVTHQRFIVKGKITGQPNQKP